MKKDKLEELTTYLSLLVHLRCSMEGCRYQTWNRENPSDLEKKYMEIISGEPRDPDICIYCGMKRPMVIKSRFMPAFSKMYDKAKPGIIVKNTPGA